MNNNSYITIEQKVSNFKTFLNKFAEELKELSNQLENYKSMENYEELLLKFNSILELIQKKYSTIFKTDLYKIIEKLQVAMHDNKYFPIKMHKFLIGKNLNPLNPNLHAPNVLKSKSNISSLAKKLSHSPTALPAHMYTEMKTLSEEGARKLRRKLSKRNVNSRKKHTRKTSPLKESTTNPLPYSNNKGYIIIGNNENLSTNKLVNNEQLTDSSGYNSPPLTRDFPIIGNTKSTRTNLLSETNA